MVADISFTTRLDLDTLQAELTETWDVDEFYWSAEDAITAKGQRGLAVAYTPVAPFSGVYVITRAET